MKRKVKKFNEGGKAYDKEDEGILGGKINYREEDGRKYVAGKATPFDRNPSEQRYYSMDDVKGKLSSLFGGKKEDEPKKSTTMPSGYEKLDATEGNARTRQIGDYIKKSEPKVEEEYKPTGKTFLREEADIEEKPAKKATPAVKKSKIEAAAPAPKKAKASMDAGIPKDTKSTRMPSGYENLDPRSPQEKSRGKKQGVIQYEKGRSMSDWSRNLGKKPESDEEEDKPSRSIFSTKSPNRSYKSGGSVKSASARADGCAIRGKTRA